MSGKLWTDEEKKFVQSNLDFISTKQIAYKIGRTHRAVQHLCQDMGWSKSKHKVGDKINELTIEEIYLIDRYGQKISMAKCLCSCGERKAIKLTSVTRNFTRSCGCIKRKKAAERMRATATHNASNHPLYSIWCGMRNRCSYLKHISYHNYGGKGVTVCDEWKNNFVPFYIWSLENGYKLGLTIDRKDSNLNYCPENCRWVDWNEQNNNKKSNVNITAWGETKTLSNWTKDPRCQTKAFNIQYRLSQGYTPEDAISIPKFGFYKKKTNKG